MLYKITLNWYGEIHILYTNAKGENEAKRNARTRLKEKLGKDSLSEITCYFDGRKDNMRIEKIFKKTRSFNSNML